MKKPLVSICIPTHNRPDLLKQALQSATSQTYKNIEIIISDNSTDNKSKLLMSQFKDNRIKYYKNKISITSFLNVSKVAHLAKGKYIKYLLDDDLLKPDCVDKMVKVLEKYPKVGVVMAPLDIIDDKGLHIQPRFYFFKKMKYLYKYLNKNEYLNKKIIMQDFLTRIYPCCVPTGIMFRKSLFDNIGGFDEKYSYIVDLEICMNFATKMDFYYIDEFLSSWRYSSTSETVSILHKKGIKLDIFYKLTNKYLAYTQYKKSSYFFASKRTAINIFAGIKSGNLNLIFETIKTILYNDPYLLNKIILPFNLFFEVIKSLLII